MGDRNGSGEAVSDCSCPGKRGRWLRTENRWSGGGGEDRLWAYAGCPNKTYAQFKADGSVDVSFFSELTYWNL